MQYAKVKTIAEEYNIGVKTVRAWIRKGLITASKPDTGPILVNVQSVSKYLSGCKIVDTDTDTLVADICAGLSLN